MSDETDEFPAFDVDESSEPEGTFDTVHFYIGLLFRFSVTLRTPASRFKIHRKLENAQSPYYGHDVAHVREKFSNVGDELATRLAHAMSARREVLTYHSQHHEKMTEGVDADYTGDKMSSTAATPLDSGVSRNEDTAMDGLEEVLSQGTISSFALTESDSSSLHPPPLPHDGADGKPFQCQICYSMLEFKSSSLSSWRRHVFEDLMPYICTVPGCATPNRKYPRRREWQKHERESHYSRWCCPYEPNLVFDSSNDFKIHVERVHFSGAATDEHKEREIGDLIEGCARYDDQKVDLLCVLCQKHCSSSNDLYRHVGRHQEQLALFCLPSHLLGDEDDVEQNSDTSLAHSDAAQDASTSPEGEHELVSTQLAVPCHLCDVTFFSLREVRQHNQEAHDRFMHCTVSGCGWSFQDETDLTRHLRSVHGVLNNMTLQAHTPITSSGVSETEVAEPDAASAVSDSTQYSRITRTKEPSRPTAWVTHHVATYRLRQSDLAAYLQRKFGKEVLNGADIRFYQEHYIFRLPRSLTQDEQEEINALRIQDD
ncbi:hypothetical protein AC578_43 [Pseudocercospora eumusae]|uniref:C2H2-type domain-containing protein n=1 Tax=Pseudocercospora eumusae TaxID=321146 RepID=A0A139HP38_9PEZI|nr:hypothetical protein AC578_43 [Pseudocercospora eumusae]